MKNKTEETPIEIGDAVFWKKSKNIFRVIAFKNRLIYTSYSDNIRGYKKYLHCIKICNAYGEVSKNKRSQEYQHFLIPSECIVVTEENFDQIVNSQIEKLKTSLLKIKPHLKLQARYKRAAPLA